LTLHESRLDSEPPGKAGAFERRLPSELKAFPVPDPNGWLFTAPEGGAIAYNEFMKRVWRPVCTKAGIPEGMGPHALRHHYASLLINHGESVKTVSERLGHANAAMTQHLHPPVARLRGA
jgi:integrase